MTPFAIARRVLYLLLQFSFVGYLREVVQVTRQRSQFDSLNLREVENYWQTNILQSPIKNQARTVLVEMMFEHPGANLNSCLVHMMLAKKYQARAYALTEFGAISLVCKIANAFAISKFVSIYRFLDLKNHTKAMKETVRFFSIARYHVNSGISFVLDGQEVGDLIYDEYLRMTSLPTCQEVNLVYLSLVYNSLYRYFRYKEIIRATKATDVVITHNVYAKYGLLIKAAASVSENIEIWVTSYTKPIGITRNKASRNQIDKTQYFRKEYAALIRQHLSDLEIEREFSRIFNRRMEAKDENQIDVSFVYANNEINDVEHFRSAFRADERKKVFVMAHAFVDAVRYPLWQSYSDNYIWLRETLRLLASRSHYEEIYVKPHPSESLYPCEATARELVDEINLECGGKIRYLDRKVHNRVVFDLAKAIITSHGTVAVEAPCVGIPVIACSSCQNEQADTFFQARNAKEYKNLLDQMDELRVSTNQILSAKIAYLWFDEYSFDDTELLPGLSRFDDDNDRTSAYCRINTAFRGAKKIESQPLYQSFNYMVENGYNDLVNLAAHT
jgi:hypothetical protein